MSNTIIVAFGGISPEHEVSVLTAHQVMASLKEAQQEVVPLYITKSGRWLTGEALLELSNYKTLGALEKSSSSCTFATDRIGRPLLIETFKAGLFAKPAEWAIEAVVCAFHGSDGENGSFQGVCEQFNIPYTSSGVLGSAAGMDKVMAKSIAKAHELPVVDGFDFFESQWEKDETAILKQADELGFPVILKPANLGSSIGVARAHTLEELERAVETAFRYDAHLLIEQAIEPLMEINCSVLGLPEACRASVCERPKGAEELLSFADKYQRGGGAEKGMASADRVIPADISPELTEQIRALSTRIFSAFQCSGVARLDFLVHAETKQVYFNEINTIPGSFSFYLWEHSGMSFSELLKELIAIAVQRHQAKNGRIRSYDTNLLSEKASTWLKGSKN
ncbi:MAG: D-alanine--D-alanine ligase family protein [Bacteroidota bacterium]